VSKLGLVDTVKVEIDVQGIDLIALKKLSLVSHALAKKIGGMAGQEQATLASVLDDVIRQIEIGCATSLMDDKRAALSAPSTDAKVRG
jgi:hypothetical protein